MLCRSRVEQHVLSFLRDVTGHIEYNKQEEKTVSTARRIRNGAVTSLQT